MHQKHTSSRRGAIAVLAAVLSVIMLAMLAFAIDVGYVSLVKTQLQAAADASALAAASRIGQTDMVSTAKSVGSSNTASGRSVQINSSDVETGIWDSSALTFTPSVSTINSVRVTARTNSASGGTTPMFFGRVLGWNSLDQKASAVATVNPRDIAFVVDLSASMNYDTRPSKADTSAAVNYVQKIYDEFGFAATFTSTTNFTSPSSSQWAAYALTGGKYAGPTWSSGALNYSSTSCWVQKAITALSKTTYKSTIYYTGGSITSTEKIRRAYAYVMDKQLKTLMPDAVPAINSTDSFSYTYWKDYIDFPINHTINNHSYWNEYACYSYKNLGYASYVQYMMCLGRDGKTASGYYTPLSASSSYCPYHADDTDAGPLSFPPEERPTHSARVAIIDAIQIVKTRNSGISDTNQRDWVSIVTFDKSAGTQIFCPLTDDYDAVIDACRKLQACSSGGACTFTEDGLTAAHDHIQPTGDGGQGRTHVNKILVLLTDGKANIKSSSNTAISNYMLANPSTYWLTDTSDSYYWTEQAALMQVHKYQGNSWFTYPVGLGLDYDDTFMDKMANIAGTADKYGNSMGSTDPTTAIEDLKEIFSKIVTRPKLRLVK